MGNRGADESRWRELDEIVAAGESLVALLVGPDGSSIARAVSQRAIDARNLALDFVELEFADACFVEALGARRDGARSHGEWTGRLAPDLSSLTRGARGWSVLLEPLSPRGKPLGHNPRARLRRVEARARAGGLWPQTNLSGAPGLLASADALLREALDEEPRVAHLDHTLVDSTGRKNLCFAAGKPTPLGERYLGGALAVHPLTCAPSLAGSMRLDTSSTPPSLHGLFAALLTAGLVAIDHAQAPHAPCLD